MSEPPTEREELEAQLTHVAAERVAYERCAGYLTKKCAVLFADGKDAEARLVRDYANEVRQWTTAASKRQDEILKQLHPEIYK